MSQTHSYTMDDIDWSLTVDQKKLWAPECLISIAHLPVYKTMNPELKLLWNQMNALGVAENFMFFEEMSLVPSMQSAIKKVKDPELKEAMQHFIDEEIKHAACFKKLLQKAAPDLYPKDNFQFRFIKLGLIGKLSYLILKAFPMILPAWIWLAIFFEERTLMFSKEYIKSNKKDQTIDSLFFQTHYYHMLDEVRHVKMDEYFIDNFYKTFGKFHARLGVQLITKVLKRVTYPISMAQSCVAHIKMLRPDLMTIELENRIYKELETLSKTESFIQQNLGQAAAPRTRFLMKKFNEFTDFWVNLSQA